MQGNYHQQQYNQGNYQQHQQYNQQQQLHQQYNQQQQQQQGNYQQNYQVNSNNNRLLNSYQSHKQSNVPFKNNSLLYNNPQVKIRRLEQMNELDNKIDKEKIRESVIKPMKLEKNNKDINQKYTTFEKEYAPTLNKLYATRTNQPYKNIIKDEKHIQQFLEAPVPKSNVERENLHKKMIIHRITNADKEGVTEDFEALQSNIEKHNDELKVLYSASNELEHKKQFEYNHKYKYRVKYDPSDHSKMKEDRITFYKKQQEKAAEGEQKRLEIVEKLLNTGIFTEEELKEHGVNKVDSVSSESPTKSPMKIQTVTPTKPQTTVPTKVQTHTITPSKIHTTAPNKIHTTAPSKPQTTVSTPNKPQTTVPTRVQTTAPNKPQTHTTTVPTRVHTTAPNKPQTHTTTPTRVHTTVAPTSVSEVDKWNSKREKYLQRQNR